MPREILNRYPLIWAGIGLLCLLDFVLMGLDKGYARRKRRRVPERTLLGVAALGGALGGLLGMLVFRHKTRHRAFSWGLPLLAAAQIAIGALAVCRLTPV